MYATTQAAITHNKRLDTLRKRGPQEEDSGHQLPLTRKHTHMLTERQRRKGMSNLFVELQAVLPETNRRMHADRCTVLTEVIDYIGALETQLEELRRKKALVLGSLSEFEQHNTTWNEIQAGTPVTGKKHENTRLLSAGKKPETFAAASVTVYARDSVIMVSSPRKKGLWSELILLLHQQDVEIVNVTLASTADSYFHWIHAKVVEYSYVGYY